MSTILSDRALSRRLERAEARSNADFVEARARAQPEVGATWIDVAGTYAMFDGAGSPLTQTFGLGVFDPVTEAHLDRLEHFFRERGAPVCHEVSPMADQRLLALLTERGYTPIELTSVMCRAIDNEHAFLTDVNPKIQIRIAHEDELEQWAQTAARGWSETPELADFVLELSRVSAHRTGTTSFLAECDGKPIATGALSISDGVALLAGASTVPEDRNQGAQRALLDARLRHAAAHGCDLAMMCALPGSASQRNAQRHGFLIAYTRIKWQRS